MLPQPFFLCTSHILVPNQKELYSSNNNNTSSIFQTKEVSLFSVWPYNSTEKSDGVRRRTLSCSCLGVSHPWFPQSFLEQTQTLTNYAHLAHQVCQNINLYYLIFLIFLYKYKIYVIFHTGRNFARLIASCCWSGQRCLCICEIQQRIENYFC